MRPTLLFTLGLFALAGCHTPFNFPDEGVPRDLSPPRDLSVARDLAPADLGTPDLAAPDLAAPDLKPPADLAKPVQDLINCGGGYLNSDAGNACPLACSTLVEAVPDEGAAHVDQSVIPTYKHNPPASGPHWGFVAPWGRSHTVVPRPWWVHNLEHGGIVLLYNCPKTADGGTAPDGGGTTSDGGAPIPNDCPEVIAAFQMLHDNHPLDEFGIRRILITPDPELPGRLAAVAWGWSYVDSKVDLNALSCFIAARYGRGPENAP